MKSGKCRCTSCVERPVGARRSGRVQVERAAAERGQAAVPGADGAGARGAERRTGHHGAERRRTEATGRSCGSARRAVVPSERVVIGRRRPRHARHARRRRRELRQLLLQDLLARCTAKARHFSNRPSANQSCIAYHLGRRGPR